MDRDNTFGIVGGYGATGKAVASELSKSCDAKILLGGRDLNKTEAVAAQFDSKISATHLDVLDDRSLDDFCRRSSIIVNCAGPVMLLQDRVAQAAFRQGCHYIDPAGMSVVKERMLVHSPKMGDSGLSCIVSAGWMPGLTEILPMYAVAKARGQMDAIETVTVYYGDSGEWSESALRDGVWYLRQLGLHSPGYFDKGQWTSAKTDVALQRANLGEPIGERRFCLFSTPELNEIGRSLTDCNVFTYTYLSGLRTVLDSFALALLPLPEGLRLRMLRNVFRRNRLPVRGFVVVLVEGRSHGESVTLNTRISFEGERDYWIHGVAMATTARMVLEGKHVARGVNFVADAVDPIAFLAELRKAGVEQTEGLESTAQPAMR